MASNKELNRMIYNLEGEIKKIMDTIKRLPSPFEGNGIDRDPDTGLSKQFLKLKSRHSLLIKISTELQKQHLNNQLKERRNNK